MNHDEHIREALDLEALGALDAEARRALEEHAALCAECARERASLADLTALLAHAAPPVVPPTAIRENLLRRVREIGREEQAEGGRVLRPAPERFRRRVPAWVSYGALAASLILAVLLLTSWRENRALRRELAASEGVRAELASLRRELGESVRQRDELKQLVGELMTAPGAGLARMAGTKDAPQARASYAYDRESGRALLLAAGLPPAPEGKAYQLWYFEDKTPLPGPVFQIDADGRATFSDTIPAQWRSARSFAVTLEPAGGVREPTGSVYLAGPAT